MQFLCMLCGKQPAQFKARKARRSDANNPAGCSCRIERWPWGASSCRHEMRLPGLSNRKLPHRYLYQCGNPIFRYCPIHTKNILTLITGPVTSGSVHLPGSSPHEVAHEPEEQEHADERDKRVRRIHYDFPLRNTRAQVCGIVLTAVGDDI